MDTVHNLSDKISEIFMFTAYGIENKLVHILFQNISCLSVSVLVTQDVVHSCIALKRR
jgi:hypothetical protein